ncbi:MAG: GAF domain-containing protein [Deltaproteobacteria bacterium]|nr:GAF domain-containing protein [Deltaproteobacteria bacterium]
MAKYEVFLPAAREGGFNLTLKVDADNWMAALKAGLTKLGEQGAQVSNLLVDIMEDNSIHVSDTASGRVFRIKELEEASSAPQPLPLAQTAPLPLTQPAAAAPAPTLLEKAPGRELPGGEAPTPREMAAVEPPPEPPRPAAPPQAVSKPTPPPAKPAPEKPAKHAAKVTEKPADRITEKPVVAKPEAPKTAKPAAPPAPRADSVDPRRVEQVDRPSQPISGPIGRSRTQTQIEDVLSDLFERTQDAFSLEAEQGLSFLLDLALEKIPAESGSVFVSNFAANDLELASARGPKAPELKRLKLRMPVGVGIVGFCAQEAVSLAISDTEKDPRFYRTVSDKLGYDTRSILCAPMVSGGRTFGCIEVINKKGTSHFTDSEVAILAYVAHQGAKYLEQISP